MEVEDDEDKATIPGSPTRARSSLHPDATPPTAPTAKAVQTVKLEDLKEPEPAPPPPAEGAEDDKKPWWRFWG